MSDDEPEATDPADEIGADGSPNHRGTSPPAGAEPPARSPDDAAEEGPRSTSDRRARLTAALLIGPIIVLVIASYIGDALAPTLVDKHPLLLIALNARNRNLILATNQLDTASYYVVGTLRLLLSDPLFYLLGMRYGEKVVGWIERKSPANYGPMIRMAEKFFAKASYPLVFIAPNNAICLFAGASGMNVGAFVSLNVAGTLVRLYLIRRLGDAFDEPISAVLRFVDRYRTPLLILSVASVAYTIWTDRRQGRSDIHKLTKLEKEHQAEDDDRAT